MLQLGAPKQCSDVPAQEAFVDTCSSQAGCFGSLLTDLV